MAAFKVDLSMIGWTLLSSISFGAVGVFWSNPYTTAIDAEVYLQLRREANKNKIEGYEELMTSCLTLTFWKSLWLRKMHKRAKIRTLLEAYRYAR